MFSRSYIASLLQNPLSKVPAIGRVNFLRSFRACCVVWQGGVIGNVHDGLFGVGGLDVVGGCI